ncbi:MAG: hypothetical protein E6Q94_09685 [Burkholderiaceae bacterium]|nr:MAG: hypothetical protein E6Q94_09685 [Burkholderiaceae bacterium]
MVEMFERIDLSQLTQEQLAPLEALMPPGWPDVWRSFATSFYITLLSSPGAGSAPAGTLARQAVELALGLAQDEGGTQPYIPVGVEVMSSARARRVIELLERRLSYKQVAALTRITVSRVRKIQRAWRHEQAAARQGQLPLG